MDDDIATPAAPAPPPPVDEGGDPACWASLLCPNCGAVPDSRTAAICPRCGQPYPADDD
ncbi:MAG TPA: hypothetical protein VF218_06275 [Acidothermaceae bacterium]|jgi:hypothetical protein